MTGPDLLLVTPGFHGYGRSIAEALTRRGYAVRTHVYDLESTLGRVRHKLAIELPTRLGRATWATETATSRAAEVLRQARPDVLLVVKGDILGEDFWAQAQSVPRRALWLYDELRRTEHTTESLAAAGPIGSYSPNDVADLCARGLPALTVPLAHDQTIPINPRPSSEVSFVGARYPTREALLEALQQRGIRVRAHGRDWSGHPLDRLRTWRVGRPAVPAGRDLSRREAYGVMAGSVATLNIHGEQDGFTMRTFEAAGIGGLELVDRADVGLHYEPGVEVAVFTSADEAVELCRRAERDPVWAWGIREAGRRRTLAEHTFDHRVAALESLWA